MADKILPILGTKQEVDIFTEVNGHYVMAKEDLQQRIQRKNGFDDSDKMYSSYIDEKNWPFKSVIFDPRPYTVILEKSARLVGSKPKGRLVPREGGDTLGAYVNNELLSYEWDDNTRLGESMISKWIQMDQNTRKYGAAFGICKWRYECKVTKDSKGAKKKVFYDGPDFQVINPRDVLSNPSYTFINKWFQHREYTTISDLETINDSARKEPIYKNLDLLKTAVRESDKTSSGGTPRDANYVNQNKQMRGLSDYMGRDKVFKTIEIVTEYRSNRWITFAPKFGVVIRDIDNPYKHQEIPVFMLRYYPLGDDLYGMSELEPVAKIFRAINAFLSQFSDDTVNRLYPPLMVNPVNVRMHTLDYAPEAKWLMNSPGVDVMKLDMGPSTISAFNTIYQTLVGAALSALGESSQGVSQANPTQDAGRVTATEIKDTSFTRNVRDNMNQIFLSESLKKQIMFWHSMNQQFMFEEDEKAKVIRIVGRDAIRFFQTQGLDEIRPTEDDVMAVANGSMTQEDIPAGPRFAVNLDGVDVPKFQPDTSGQGGNLLVEPNDMIGDYDYIPDIETMKAPSDADIESKMTMVLETVSNSAIVQGLASEGKRPKYEDILVKLFESTNVIKNAEDYFEELPQAPAIPGQMPGQPNGQPQTGGIPGAIPSPQGGSTNPNGGLPGIIPPMAAGQNQPLMA